MRAVIYARYSSENQREASLEDQVEAAGASSTGKAGRSRASTRMRR